VFLASFFAFAGSGMAPGLAMAQVAPTAKDRPELMLANRYSSHTPLAEYWVSEKYDGVRGFWTGQQLMTRGGEVVHAPAWFTAGWPDTPMDGELWAGRGQFAHAVSTVRQQAPDDAAWHRMRFMVFDLPAHSGLFTERIDAYQRLVNGLQQTWVVPVPQWRVASHAELLAQMKNTVKAGGEGLMLHRANAPYRGGRSDDLLKVKPSDDAEARVVAHVPGRGKYAGKLGALMVETPEGLRFKLGTGFTDADRAHPPPVGAVVTYRYRGLNDSGVPRFASYWRVRAD
jgi:DNA ligase-1